MPELATVTISTDGYLRGDQPWTPPAPCVCALEIDTRDRRAFLLDVAARARDESLAVVHLDPTDLDRETVLARLDGLPPELRPRGLLLGEAWQEIVAARCATLTGAALDLGLVDAVRIDDADGWQGHHLVAGAVEAFLAQVWPDSVGPLPRAVILGGGATAMTAALIAARRGAADVTLVVDDPQRRDDLAARAATAVNWPASTTWQVTGRYEFDSPPAGLWVRATDRDIPDAAWLPDAAGDEPCAVIDLAGATKTAPLGSVHPDAGGVQVMAAGLAAAWYLGPPVPWDALTNPPSA